MIKYTYFKSQCPDEPIIATLTGEDGKTCYGSIHFPAIRVVGRGIGDDDGEIEITFRATGLSGLSRDNGQGLRVVMSADVAQALASIIVGLSAKAQFGHLDLVSVGDEPAPDDVVEHFEEIFA